jgi:membrane protease YdiL (CAAX protease family)
MKEKRAGNIMKKPLIKAIFFTFIPVIFATIAGTVISIMELDTNSSIIVQSICFFVSIMVGIIITKILHFQFNEIGINIIQKNTSKKVFYFIPLIIIEILPFFNGFNEQNNYLRIILLIIFTVIVGVNEELYFRGIIVALYKNNGIKAIIVSSILFGVGHIANAFSNSNYLYIILQIIFAFIIGIVYAEIVIITKSIIPAIIFHAVHDFIGMVTNDNIVGKSFLVLIIQMIVLIIYIIIMWKEIKYKSSPNCT